MNITNMAVMRTRKVWWTPALNRELRHDTLKNEWLAPRILNLDIRQRQVLSYSSGRFSREENASSSYGIRGCLGLRVF
jgi:hypothetical protein